MFKTQHCFVSGNLHVKSEIDDDDDNLGGLSVDGTAGGPSVDGTAGGPSVDDTAGGPSVNGNENGTASGSDHGTSEGPSDEGPSDGGSGEDLATASVARVSLNVQSLKGSLALTVFKRSPIIPVSCMWMAGP